MTFVSRINMISMLIRSMKSSPNYCQILERQRQHVLQRMQAALEYKKKVEPQTRDHLLIWDQMQELEQQLVSINQLIEEQGCPSALPLEAGEDQQQPPK